MVKILAIGNSFSDDATRYLFHIAKADDVPMLLFNLCIGGCPLEKHFRMMRSGDSAYAFRFNSEDTGLPMSLKTALTAHSWDFVTLQQVSHQAPRYETYQPYLTELADYIRSYQPKAKIVMQQTWAYEQDSKRLNDELGYKDQADMFNDIKASYDKAAASINAAGIIPSGELFQRMIKNGYSPIHRDTFHAHLGKSRYALGLLWYDLLTGHSAEGNPYRALDVPSDDLDFAALQRLVHETANDYRF